MDTRAERVDDIGVRTPPTQCRPGSLGPLATGAWWGVLTGAVVGVATGLLLIGSTWASGPEYAPQLGDLPWLLLSVALGGLVGLGYGAVVGFVAAFGAVWTPRASIGRRLLVSGLAVVVGGLTVAFLTGPGESDVGFFTVGPFFLPVMAVVAWFLAPRLPGREADTTAA